jgi:DNA topoisomerase-1
VLQDRDYVRLEKRRFVPEDRGRLVTAFLSSFFERYVEYNFTADLETQLDDISGGRKAWKTVLAQFWDAFNKKVGETKDLSISDVIDTLDRDLGPHFFPADPEAPDKNPRACPTCGDGRLGLKLGRSGGFVGCSNYPDCRYTRPLAVPGAGDEAADAELAGPRELGTDPETGETVTLRKGPYGVYLQRGEPKGPKGKEKPPRVSLPKGLAPTEITLDMALALLALPRSVGAHPETGQPITAGIGRYGPYVKHESTYRNIPDPEDVLTIGLNRAVALIAEAATRRRAGAGAGAGKEIGSDPHDGKPITLHSGRYGPYVKHGRTIASLPRDQSADELSFERALELLTAKAEKDKAKGKGKKTAAPAKKKTAKKAKRAKKAKKAAN